MGFTTYQFCSSVSCQAVNLVKTFIDKLLRVATLIFLDLLCAIIMFSAEIFRMFFVARFNFIFQLIMFTFARGFRASLSFILNKTNECYISNADINPGKLNCQYILLNRMNVEVNRQIFQTIFK